MAYYRLYSLDVRKKHFTDVFHFNSETDASAISEVVPDCLGVARELWNQGRKVQDFASKSETQVHRELQRLSDFVVPQGHRRWNPFAGHCQAISSAQAM